MKERKGIISQLKVLDYAKDNTGPCSSQIQVKNSKSLEKRDIPRWQPIVCISGQFYESNRVM